MRKKLAIAEALALSLPSAALAQTVDASNAVPAAAGAGMMAGLLLLLLFIVVLNIALLVFWVFMLIDCLKREWPEKNTWVVALIVSVFFGFHWLSSALYYFMIKRQNVGSVRPPAPPAPPVPPAA